MDPLDVSDDELEVEALHRDEIPDLSKHHKATEHETRLKTSHLFLIIALTILLVTVFTGAAYVVGEKEGGYGDSGTENKPPASRNPTLSSAHAYSDCDNFDGAIQSVQDMAEGEGYLHQFEYDRYHPCCRLPDEPSSSDSFSNSRLNSDDVVFIIMSSGSAAGESKARSIMSSWGLHLTNLLFVNQDGNNIHFEFDDDTISEMPSHPPASWPSTSMDRQHFQIWALRYLWQQPEYAALRDKKWFFLADDETWVNLPALLDLVNSYDSRCPVAFGYVWSRAWEQDLDYIAGGAGLLLSNAAYSTLVPAFFTDSCPYAHYDDVTFAKCAWALQVQIVHHRGFYFDPPERSKDRHETVWFPPIAEAITYHQVRPNEMSVMTDYANERWHYSQEQPQQKEESEEQGTGERGSFSGSEETEERKSKTKKEGLTDIPYLYVDTSQWGEVLQKANSKARP